MKGQPKEVVYGHIYVCDEAVYTDPGYARIVKEFFAAMNKRPEDRNPDDVEDIENDYNMLCEEFPGMHLTKEELYSKLKEAGLKVQEEK